MAAGIAATGGYFLLPGVAAKDIAYVVIGLTSTLAMAVAVRLHRPAARLCWWLLVAASLSSVTGNGVQNIVYGMVLHRPLPFPSIADALYLGCYPVFFVGLALLTRPRAKVGSRENYADATILVLAALAISWSFVMRSYFHDHSMGGLGRLVMLGYPAMDLGLLFILVRSLIFGAARLPVHRILMASFASMLVADFGYDVLSLHNSYATGNPIDAGWLLSFVLMAVAALHPTMANPPRAVTDEPETRRRIPVLAVAGLVAPVILLVGSELGVLVDVPVIAGTSIVVFALVALRMSWLFDRTRSQTRQLQADAVELQEALVARDSLESELRYQAFHDGLTGLANRTLLHDRVEHALAGSAHAGGVVAVCFCDLDSFKTVNDSLGHRQGDELLCIAAKRLQSIVRPGDTVARLGGDEFAVLMDSVASPEAATAVAARIVAVLRNPVDIDGRPINLSVSVGVAFGAAETTTEQILSEADAAMYAAKANGKSRYATFEASMHRKNVERLELTNGFSGALERSEFFLQYQPQFSMSDSRLEGFEALARWDHPRLGPVSPGRFIPLAEETGFIVALGRWVLETACEHAAVWFARHDSDLTMSVNLSGRQLQDEQLCDDIRTALALSGLPPHKLVLEFTESILMADCEEVTTTLAELKGIGVQLALDDFGTGYSSLGYLQRFPLDALKIDKSFVDPLGGPDYNDAALVSAITVAEGIEEEVQKGVLTRLGCDSAQGFLMGRPLDEEKVTALLVDLAPDKMGASGPRR